jgi:c-di-GMP-binding flagellar brake protein YcgR
MSGYIKDISLGGAGLEIGLINKQVFPFRIGEEFILYTTLPNEKDVEFACRLVSIKEGKSQATLILGVSFFDVSEHSTKNLGFFLMP